MLEAKDELARREKLARAAMKSSLRTEAGEFGATLFATHHLEELDAAYWQERVGTAKPDPEQIIEILSLQSDCDDELDEDDLDSLDFCLPGEVSQYLLCVTFDEDGEVEDISMES